jgi:hypothetical protein
MAHGSVLANAFSGRLYNLQEVSAEPDPDMGFLAWKYLIARIGTAHF